jgi:hypothetical protein
VEAQHENATRGLVDSDEEQELLERMIESSKPPLVDADGFHFLLSTPFRYPPLKHGSRFGSARELGIWYGSEEAETAFAENAYYMFLMQAGTSASLDRLHKILSLFSAPVSSSMVVDVTVPPFDEHATDLTSKVRYAAPQALGSDARAAGVEIIRYPSARDPQSRPNVAVLSKRAFSQKNPTVPSTWDCFMNGDRVEVSEANYFDKRSYRFNRAQFEVGGALPSPAT